MARIRYIKPEFFEDSDLSKLPPLFRIAFAGLWCHADKEGRLKDRPEELKIKILPYDDINFNDILDKLATPKRKNVSFIVRYSVNGDNYIQINKFREHQKPHHTEKESILPPLPLTVKKRLKTRSLTPSMGMEKGMGKGMEKGMESVNIPFTEIITDLNEKTSKNYKLTKATKELINARISEGFTLEDFKKVHTNMSAKWKHDPKMNQYLRPTTLYAISKFEGYLNAGVSLSDKGIISEKTEKGMQVMKDFIGGVNAQ